ncbi:MAG: hydantoinase B/oxoprolinase family protein [Janthinobacterium lividum]
MKIDPIKLEVFHNALRSIVDEGYLALMRSAYSSNIKERHDHSAAIIDCDGRLVAQTERNIPMHMGSMFSFIGAIRRVFTPDAIKPGDIFVANDPFHAGGTHLPDISLAIPIFDGDRLIAFFCNVAHHSDIGGIAPGGMDSRATEIYHEGLRIPPIKLVREGVLDDRLLELLLTNVRIPHERRGDYYAQIAGCRLCDSRMKEVIGKYGSDFLLAAFDELIQRTEMRMRRALAAVKPGKYYFEDVMDSDGQGARDIPIKVAITVTEHKIEVDFSGTAAQVKGNINSPLSATVAAVGYAVKAMLDPAAPNNAGFFSIIDIIAPAGSLVHAVFPAPVANRQQTCQRIADIIIGALTPALPERGTAASHGATVLAGFASGSDAKQLFIYLEVVAGGGGGRYVKDGKDGAQVHTTNSSNLPVEAIELEYPLLVESYGFVQDSGGAGRHRGGLGIQRTLRYLCASQGTFSGHAERFTNRPWGVDGGESAASGSYLLIRANGEQQQLDSKAAGIAVQEGDRVIATSPGGGGYGAPSARAPEALRADYTSGKYSLAFLQQHYPDALLRQAGLIG